MYPSSQIEEIWARALEGEREELRSQGHAGQEAEVTTKPG